MPIEYTVKNKTIGEIWTQLEIFNYIKDLLYFLKCDISILEDFFYFEKDFNTKFFP